MKNLRQKYPFSIHSVLILARKELLSCFISPLAYIFMIIFLLLAGLVTFGESPFGNFLGNNMASLTYSLFSFFPWLFLVLIPPISMRMWSEEQKSGSIELLLTMPISVTEAVIGKFIASWLIVTVSILLTFPLIITVNYLGNPDNVLVFSGYVSSILLAGSYVAIGSITSALCKNQIISFIFTLIICLFLLLIGHPALNNLFSSWTPVWIANMLSDLSLFPHFSYIQKGSFEVEDITYFLSIIIFGIVSSRIIIKTRYRGKNNDSSFRRLETNSPLTAIVSILAILVVLININFLIGRIFTLPIDITTDRLYSFSQGTKNILKNLKHPVTIRFYRSYSENSLPVQLLAYAERIEDLLRAYSNHAEGKIILEYYDPVPESSAEESAVMDGIQTNTLPTGEKCYFGLTISYMNRNSTIAFLSPANEKVIEYDITRSIYDLTHPEKPVVGVISSLPVMGGITGMIPSRFTQSPPWIFLQELQEMFDVRSLPYNLSGIDDKINILLVIHPVGLPSQTEFAIDQFLLKGGSLMIFLDPYCIVKTAVTQIDPLSQSPVLPDSSNLPRLLNAWGMDFSQDQEVVISPENAYRQIGDPSAKVHPGVLNILPGTMAKSDIITAGLNSLNLIFCGGFNKYNDVKSESIITSTALFFTSPYANFCNNFNYYLTPEELTIDFKPLNHPINLGLYLTGFFNSAFPEGISSDTTRNSIKKSTKQGNVILVGDADMLFNNFCVTESKSGGKTVLSVLNGNIDFVLNSVDFLSGDTDIMSIRSRSSIERKFTRLEELYNQTARIYQDKLSTLQKKLVDAESSVSKIQGTDNSKNISQLTSDELQALQKFRKEARKARTELHSIRKELRTKLDRTKTSIIFFDVALIPILLGILGITVAIVRRRKHKKNLIMLNIR
ncbi:MAG TPA: hypothetical protein DD381_12170 [Lentisphaeria bacterium]|nr:MAG: hypothetical protein A2X47_09560 [Lentisphaerae bacterium GWF2_38_69]HBM17082.1 hypothetical protein [Lentisphaeria bacterium]